MTKEEAIRRAHNAQRLIEDECFTEAVSTLTDRLMRRWLKEAETTEEREQIYYQLKALQDMVGHLTQLMKYGKHMMKESD